MNLRHRPGPAAVTGSLLVASLLMAGQLVSSAAAIAAPIDTDLVITGSVELSTSVGQSPFSDGNVSQTGQVRVTQDGLATLQAFSTTPGSADGADDGTTLPPGTNPLPGSFTATGDGLGYTTDLDASFETGDNFNEGYDFIVAFGIDLTNNSATDTFTVTVAVSYSNVVDAGGDDAFAEAGMDVEVDNADVLVSDVTSDTLLGDSLNGADPGTAGAEISDIGTSTFDVTLGPGGTATIGGVHQWEGGVFVDPGNSNADIDVDITIAGVECVGPNCAPPAADLEVTKTDGVTSAVPGQSLAYTITATNKGPDAVADAALTDAFPADLTCAWTSAAEGGASGNSDGGPGPLDDTLALPPGAKVTYTVDCSIDPAAAGTLSNTATISSATVTDPNPGNNSATDADTVLAPEADLAVTKTDNVTEAKPGGGVTYTLVAENAGPSTVADAAVTDAFPADLTCAWTSAAEAGASGNSDGGPGPLDDTLALPPGAKVTYTVDCSIDPAAAGTLSNTATISSATVTDPNPGNDSATDADTVLDEDNDDDGEGNVSEDAGPNQGDGNFDGTPDRDQANVVSLPNAVDGQYLTLAVSGGCARVDGVEAVTEADLGDDPDHDYPTGLLSFQLPCDRAEIAVYYHGQSTAPDLEYRKYGPETPDSAQSVSWYSLPSVTFGLEQGVPTARFTLNDGQLGDDDTGPLAQGWILDPGGLTRRAPGPGPGSRPAPIPTLSPWALAVLALLVMGILARHGRRAS